LSSKKSRVAILFGGRSTEHKISILSAKNVIKSIDKEKYEPILIAIDKQGTWHRVKKDLLYLDKLTQDGSPVIDLDDPVLLSQNNGEHFIYNLKSHNTTSIDVLYPVLHGTYGEDGSVQGLAKLAGLPCVGCGILGSAIGMDKDIMKHVLLSMDIPVASWATVRNSADGVDYSEIAEQLGSELFIKPANLGSSVGVSHTTNEEQFFGALEKALSYDSKVIVEEKVVGREIECAVLGNAYPKASVPGEIVSKGGFYSYENKYVDEKGAELLIPAVLIPEQTEAVQQLALETYVGLECRGLTRVDMFMTPDGELIINEVNTIPGFTDISMYPKLWEASGLSQTDLITELIELAKEELETLNQLVL